MLVVGVTSFREREQILGFFVGECVCFDLVGCNLVEKRERERAPTQVPASPFIVPKGRAQVTVVVKR
jgi:hypothetical protein